MDDRSRIIALSILAIVLALLLMVTSIMLLNAKADAASVSPNTWSESTMHDYIFKESK